MENCHRSRYEIPGRNKRIKAGACQTKQVIEKLKSAFPEDEFDVVIIKTTGDMDQKSRLDQIGSKGIFVKKLRKNFWKRRFILQYTL